MSSNISITRICQHCGNEFTAKTTVTKFCGDQCAKRDYKLRRKTAKQQKTNEKINESNRQTQLVRDAPGYFGEVGSSPLLVVMTELKLIVSSTNQIQLYHTFAVL